MQHQSSKVWYASYGSNLSFGRFLCYIQGGQPKGSSTLHTGCRDKTPPLDNEEIFICSELYFARQSASWDNGGVAFIRSQFEESARTLGRMYLITVEQFIDVVKQEIDHEGDLALDFDKAIQEGSNVFQQTEWYGNLVYLGEHYNYPIFTFTSERDIQPHSKPSPSYLRTIITGIQETYNHLSPNEIVEYLITRNGVKDNYSRKEILSLIENIQT